MTVRSFRQEWADLGIAFFLTPCGKNVTVEASDTVLTPLIIEEIKKHKPEIIDWLTQKKEDKFLPPSFAEKETTLPPPSDKQWHSLNDLSSEEITHYRLLLEASYLNPAHDAWHEDEIPQQFRESRHTFEEMETALERFIHRIQTEKEVLN